MKFLRRLSTLFDYTIDIWAYIASVLVFYIVVAVLTEVFMRYFLGHATTWAVETSQYALLYITFLGAAWVLKKEAHVNMDLIINSWNPKTQSLINSITSILGAIACLVLTWYSLLIVISYYQTGFYYPSMLETPKVIVAAIVPPGSLLLAIQFLRRSLRYMKIWKTPP
jgi:C4-dicarboxylate transporter DctQ subunit